MKLQGRVTASLGGGRFIGIDFGEGDFMTECEVQVNGDGSVTVMDIRETPTPKEGSK
tara:strand:+ start:22604 stop:22774 length:171 start_codon:yes stop_codon:yes gene_type:complete